MLNKKTIVGLAVLGVSSLVAANSFAATQGAYVGGQLGWGDIHQKASSSYLTGTTVHANKDTGVAGRVFGGYRINENFAGEMGVTKFSDAKVKASSYGYTAQGTVKAAAVDLVAKGIYPVANNVSVYGKAGVAYVSERADIKVSNASRVVYKDHDKANRLLPTFGAGVSYDFTQNVAADLSYNRIQKTGSSSKINSTDLVSVGLIYSIG